MWLTVEKATEHFAYGHVESFRNRLRQLRDEGKVSDIGDPPEGYKSRKDAPIEVLWSNPKSMMINSDAPRELLNSTVGRPKKGTTF